jgi:hypothetical protein
MQPSSVPQIVHGMFEKKWSTTLAGKQSDFVLFGEAGK